MAISAAVPTKDLPADLGAGLQYLGEDPSVYVSYVKRTNRAEADYSDVIQLTDVLNNTPDDSYLDEVEQVVNIDQWLRTIAMIELSGYSEFSLLTGDPQGDDYAMYRGVNDTRFQMVPYDLDGMFNDVSGSIFSALNVPALEPIDQSRGSDAAFLCAVRGFDRERVAQRQDPPCDRTDAGTRCLG